MNPSANKQWGENHGTELVSPGRDQSFHQNPSSLMDTSLTEPLDDLADDEDWNRRAWGTFSKVARRGVLDIDQFVTWAAELNVEADALLIQRILPEDQWKRITFEVALKTLETIPHFVLNEDLLETDDSTPHNVIKLGPFGYVWTMWLCGTKDPEKTYEFSFSCHLSPRFWLLANAAGVFFVISAVIMVLMSLLWRESAISRHEATLMLLQQTLSFFMNSIGDNTLDIAGLDLLDQSVTASRWMEHMWRLWVNETSDRVQNEMVQNYHLLEGAALQAIDLDVSEMMQRLFQLGSISDAGVLGLPVILAMVDKWISGDLAANVDGMKIPMARRSIEHGGDPLWEGVVLNVHGGHVQWRSSSLNKMNSTGGYVELNTAHAPMYNDTATGAWTVPAGEWCLSLLQAKKKSHGRITGVSLSGVPNSTVLFRYFPSEGAGICLTLTPQNAQVIGGGALIEKINRINIDSNLFPGSIYSSVKPELLLAGADHPGFYDVQGGGEEGHSRHDYSSQTKRFKILTKQLLVAPTCELDEHSHVFTTTETVRTWSWNETVGGTTTNKTARTSYASSIHTGDTPHNDGCVAFDWQLLACHAEKCPLQVRKMIYYNTDESITGLVYLPSIDMVVAQSVALTFMREDFRQQMIRAINQINMNIVSTIEIVWAMRDALGKIIPQITDFRFLSDCYVECKRIPESEKIIINSFGHKGAVFGLYPDYRPAPIVGGISYTEEGLDMSLVVERDVTELRQIQLTELVKAIDTINANFFADSTEILIFREEGMPVSDTFDPLAPCPQNVICTEEPGSGLGVLARSDCPDCLRRPVVTKMSPAYQTKLRFPTTCACNTSNNVLPEANNNIPIEALSNVYTDLNLRGGRHTHVGTDAVDYGSTPIRGFYSFMGKFSSFVLVKRNFADIVGPVNEKIGVMTAIAAMTVLIGVIGLIILSRRTLNKIEEEWRSYKDSIELEKKKFDDMIREIVPTGVLSKFRRGQRTVAESHQLLTYAFLDVCGFSERFKGRQAREVVRTAAYYFILYDAVAVKYGLFRLKTFGDVCVFVAGIDSKKTDPTGCYAVYAVACFAGYIVQLLSPVFAHYPQKLQQIAETYKGEDKEVPLQTLPVRIGLHTGPVTSGLVDVGNSPFYEHYGPTLALTHRLQATCQPSRAHASATFKELLDTVDREGSFEWDSLRKTMVRGRGTITSYPLRSVQLPLDEFLLIRLKIDYAQHMVLFANKSGRGGHLTSQLDSDSGGSVLSGAMKSDKEEGSVLSSHRTGSHPDRSTASGYSSGSDVERKKTQKGKENLL